MTDEELDAMLESGQTDVFTQNVSVKEATTSREIQTCIVVDAAVTGLLLSGV